MNLPSSIYIEILLNTDYNDIPNLCQSSSDFSKACQDPYFWALRAEKDYGVKQQDLLLLPCSTTKECYEWIRYINPKIGLEKASKIGSLPLVKFFVQQGANPNDAVNYPKEDLDLNVAKFLIPDRISDVELGKAINIGDLQLVKSAVKQGARNINSSMWEASKKGYLDIVKYLVDYGAEELNQGMAEGGHLDIINFLISRGANDFNEAMATAAIGGHIEIVKMMIEMGADNFTDALIEASKNGHTEIVKIMLDNAAGNYDFFLALEKAASKGHIDIVRLLLDAMSPRYIISTDEGPLYKAAKKGHFEIVKMLDVGLPYHQNKGKKEEEEESEEESEEEHLVETNTGDVINAFSAAIKGNYMDIFNYLFKSHYDLFIEFKDDLLLHAAESGNQKLVEFILDFKPKDFSDPIDAAAYDNHLNIVKLLWELRPDKSIKYTNEVLKRASYNCGLDVIKFLIQQGTNGFNEALISAAYSNKLNVVKFLVQHGANDIENAVIKAVFNKNLDVIKYLVSQLSSNSKQTLNKALTQATEASYNSVARYNYYGVVKFLLEQGANDYQNALKVSKDDLINKLIISYMS